MTAGLDRRQAQLAEPPLPPADVSTLTRDVLAATARRIAARAETMGLSAWFWGEGVVLQGMCRLARARSEPVPPFVTSFVDRHVENGIELGHVNNVAPGAVCAELLATTRDSRYAATCELLTDWLHHDPAVTRAPNGAVEHWPGGVWADTAFMAGTFLTRYGLVTGRPELVHEAAIQVLAHAELLQDSRTGLYAHGSHEGRTIWCFWGRANAWAALAAVDVLEALAQLGTDVPAQLRAAGADVRRGLELQLHALADHQPEHGVWDVLVDGQVENRGILETSAAAGIAAAMLRAGALGIAPARMHAAGWRALAGVHSYVAADGTLTRTSAGTVLQLIPFGYSVIRTDLIQPWGQGLALHAYAAALSDLSA